MSRQRGPSHAASIAIALLVTVLWSSSWVLIRIGLDDEALEPVTFAGLRYGLAALLLIGWVVARPELRRSISRVDRGSMGSLVALGVALYALTQGAQFVAIDNQPAATTSLVLAWTPMLVALLARRFTGESPSPRQIAGGALVVAGAWLYFAGELGATAAGMIAALTGLGANAWSALLGRRINRDLETPVVVITAISMSVGAGILLIAGVATEGVPSISGRAWLIIAWLAVVNTAWAFSLWNLSLRGLSAIESAGINNTMLVQIAVLAWIFLDEPLGVVEITGIGLVSIGVFLTQAVSAGRIRLGRTTHRE